MKNWISTICCAIALSVAVGCGGSEARVVGTEEEYAKTRTPQEEVEAMNQKYEKMYSKGPSREDMKAMADAAKKAAAGK